MMDGIAFVEKGQGSEFLECKRGMRSEEMAKKWEVGCIEEGRKKGGEQNVDGKVCVCLKGMKGWLS